MHAQLTYKQNEKQYYKHTLEFSLVVLLFYRRFEKLAKLLIEINKQQTANERGHRFSWFIFYKKQRQTTSLLP